MWLYGKGGVSMSDICSTSSFITHPISTCAYPNQFLVTPLVKQSSKGVGWCRVFGLFWEFCQKIPCSSFNLSHFSEKEVKGFLAFWHPFAKNVSPISHVLPVLSCHPLSSLISHHNAWCTKCTKYTKCTNKNNFFPKSWQNIGVVSGQKQLSPNT